MSGSLAVFLALSVLPGTALAEEQEAFSYEEIKPQFQAVGSFSEGLAAAKQGGKWGYVDTDGHTVVAFEYDLAYEFWEGLAIVGTYSTRMSEDRSGNQVENAVCLYGFVDHSGTYTPFQMPDPAGGDGTVPYYTYKTAYGNGEPTEHLVFHQGLVCLPGTAPAQRVYTAQGEVLETELLPAGPMGTGLAPGYSPKKEGVGYFDENGRTALWWDQADWVYFGDRDSSALGGDGRSYRYRSAVLPFDRGLAPVWETTYDAKTGRECSLLGLIDTSGSWVIQPAYTDCRWIDQAKGELFGPDGLAVVQKDGKWYGAIDRSGQVVVPFRYEELWPFQEGMAVFRQDGKYGYLDSSGAVVIPAQYDRVVGFQNGYAAVYRDGMSELIDRQGAPLPLLGSVSAIELLAHPADANGYFSIQRGSLYGFGRLEYRPPLPSTEEVDSWAQAEVWAAIEAGLVPVSLQNRYDRRISRAEFCTLAVKLLCRADGVDREALVLERTEESLYDWMGTYPFRDTSDPDVIAAYALGIVTGRGGGLFDPDAGITRQEAAAFLTRTAAGLGMDTFSTKRSEFVDNSLVGHWFREAVEFVSQTGVMGSVGKNAFDPLGTYTREQSYITIYRLFQAAGLADPGDVSIK